MLRMVCPKKTVSFSNVGNDAKMWSSYTVNDASGKSRKLFSEAEDMSWITMRNVLHRGMLLLLICAREVRNDRTLSPACPPLADIRSSL